MFWECCCGKIQVILAFLRCNLDLRDNDNKKEIYVAELSKVETKDYKALDYEYLINLMKGRKKCSKICDSNKDLQLVGKMNVSTILTLCHHDNYTMMETQFVLFGETSSPKNERKGLFQKVAKLFRTCCQKKWPESDNSSEINLLEKNVAPNFELAAIVVKEHVPFDCVDKVGGWGLKFLKTLPCECYNDRENDEDYSCSNSINVIIPAGIHGGPKSGPSSLIDRWKSGGCCDCGGWDQGCPLTVFQRKSTNTDHHMHGNCNSLDIVTQGSSSSNSTLRMRNIDDGLYYGYFEPPLSALQSFSIALAVTHSWNRSLGPFSTQKL